MSHSSLEGHLEARVDLQRQFWKGVQSKAAGSGDSASRSQNAIRKTRVPESREDKKSSWIFPGPRNDDGPGSTNFHETEFNHKEPL